MDVITCPLGGHVGGMEGAGEEEAEMWRAGNILKKFDHHGEGHRAEA